MTTGKPYPQQSLPLRTFHRGAFLLLVIAIQWNGCSASRFLTRREPALDAEMSKQQLVEHVNRNILGTESTPGLSAWKTSDAKVQVTGIPFPLPASVAVEAPLNIRIVVHHPISGAQEVDLGSNRERFWLWTKEQSEVITSRHEDIELALQQFEMPIQIQPEWLMEVFGVIPLDEAEFTLQHPNSKEPVIDLVAIRQSPTGGQVERVIRINTFSGQIQEHQIRNTNGEVIASATLDQYVKMPNGTHLPTTVKIRWPVAQTEMKITLGHPEVNPPSFATASALWNMPDVPGAKVVDIGEMSRKAVMARNSSRSAGGDDHAENIRRLRHAKETPLAQPIGKVALAPSRQLEAPHPTGSSPPRNSQIPASQPMTGLSPRKITAEDDGLPEWARGHTTNKPQNSTAVWRPSEYSEATWRSSSVPPPRELE